MNRLGPSFGVLTEDGVIPAAGSLPIVTLAPTASQDDVALVQQLIDRLGIEVCYCSIYRDCWTLPADLPACKATW